MSKKIARDYLRTEEEEAENQCDQDPTPEEARLLETMRKGFMGEIAKLQEENKKLKEGTLLKFQEVEIADLEEENKKLKEENKKLKKEHIKKIMKTNSIATELYREMKYSLGYGEFDEPDRKVMYDDIKKLKEGKS